MKNYDCVFHSDGPAMIFYMIGMIDFEAASPASSSLNKTMLLMSKIPFLRPLENCRPLCEIPKEFRTSRFLQKRLKISFAKQIKFQRPAYNPKMPLVEFGDAIKIRFQTLNPQKQVELLSCALRKFFQQRAYIIQMIMRKFISR